MKTIEAKAVVLGAQAVGKTSVVMRCVRDMFDKEVGSTIGAAFFTYKMNMDGYHIHLQIWDTAGQERFKSMAPMYYRKASVAILVYDITDLQSFNALKGWVFELKRNIDRSVYLILFGNKCDLESKREVDTAEARDYAESIGAEHLEMSALSSHGVAEGFMKVSEMLIQGLADTYAHIYDSNGVLTSSTRGATAASGDSKLTEYTTDNDKSRKLKLIHKDIIMCKEKRKDCDLVDTKA